MVYLLLAFAGIYSILWLVGLTLTLRSPDRNLLVPIIGLLGFVGLTSFAGMKANEALDNPHRLLAEKYTQLEQGMNPDQVKALFGDPAAMDEVFELTTYHIGMPKGLNRSLSKEQRHVERIEASMKVKIAGEPSKANLGRRGEGLGAPANRERGGLTGAVLKLVENDKWTLVAESGFDTESYNTGLEEQTGEDSWSALAASSEIEAGKTYRTAEGQVFSFVFWTYEDDDTPEIVAKKMGEAIDSSPAWLGVGSTDEEPNMVTITPELEENFGEACNGGNCTVQVVAASEPEPVAEGEAKPELDVTTSIIIRSKTDGKPQEFRGGASEAYMWIWAEDGVVLDTDFSNEDRIVVVGFDNHKVVGMVQAGLGVQAPEAAKKSEGGEG
jgi:hypothetical protein